MSYKDVAPTEPFFDAELAASIQFSISLSSSSRIRCNIAISLSKTDTAYGG